MTITPTPRSGVHSRARRAGFAAFVGTTIEWYDFYVYATAAALVFGPLFFPSGDRLAETAAAFATFAVAFLVRPLGGIVFGHIGDKLGRRVSLVITLLLMGAATVLVGCLPTTRTSASSRRSSSSCSAPSRASRSAANGAARCS